VFRGPRVMPQGERVSRERPARAGQGKARPIRTPLVLIPAVNSSRKAFVSRKGNAVAPRKRALR
jgi:hypothetical protein